MTSRPYEVVVVGFGNIAHGLATDAKMRKYFRVATHAQAISANSRFKFSAVVDPSPLARARAISEFGIAEAVSSVGELARPERFDVAIITSPANSRLEVLKALPALRAAMVEKPLGPDEDVAIQFANECAARRLQVQVNYWRRGDESIGHLAAGQLTDLVGDPQACFGLYGNGLYNNGSHLVDLCRMLFGPVASVQALTPEVPVSGPIRGDVHINFALSFRSGLTVSASAVDFRHFREVGIDVWGSSGRLQIMAEGLLMLAHARQENRALEGAYEIESDRFRALPISVGEALYRLYDNLADAIESRAPLMSSMAGALAVERTLAGIRRSASNGGKAVIVRDDDG